MALPLQPYLYHHDRLRPRARVFELMPELQDLIMNAFWRYWTRDFWQGFFDRSDPVKKVTWTMVRELAHRFHTRDSGVRLNEAYTHRMQRSDRYRLYLIGHVHRAGWWSWCDRKVLQTGAMRNEFAIDREGKVVRPLTKVYAEAWLRDGEPVCSSLVEVHGPEVPAGYVPDSIFDVLDEVRPILGSASERAIAASARAEQAAREAEEP